MSKDRVDIPAVDSAMTNLDEITDRSEKAVAEMRARAARAHAKRVAEALNGCWGDDDKFGEKFAKAYLTNADLTLDNCDTTVETLRDLGTGLRDIANTFQKLDTEHGGLLELTDNP